MTGKILRFKAARVDDESRHRAIRLNGSLGPMVPICMGDSQ